ncbi:kinesin-like protein KIN-10C [Cornus florida]|uniref:kinesin-like protein KIN-10C n=1 Tax=Cornus florida TaxID=4283 RepID=UPI002898AF5F|nr:kinesin-like protein KIN-10C [Cornus florida]
MAEPGCIKPSPRVRIVAKIRGFTDHESEPLSGDSTSWISVHKPKEEDSSERVKISFGDQLTSCKDAYEVDYCYKQNEDNALFSREVKPLISGVFDGQNATILAYGARGSGKTYLIQGSEKTPGLAVLAVAEILSIVEERRNSVTISSYEIFQDHVYDLLDPKRPEVLVLEDALGKIKLKGLSQVSVKSISEFKKIYFSGCSSQKLVQKKALEMPKRSHRGLIISISSYDENSNTKCVGKMNFVDLAGYEDPRRKSSDNLNLVESTRINKSLYALLNVVYALNANESRVPYRECKVTRMLQDSFGGKNHVVMLACLNPSFCQDTIYTTSLASRSCQAINRVFTGSTKKFKTAFKPMVLSSLKNGNLGTVSTTAKKEIGSRVRFSEKKGSCKEKGRKLFDEGNQLISFEQAKSTSDNASAMKSNISSNIDSAIEPSLQEEAKSTSDNTSAMESNLSLNIDSAIDPSLPEEEKSIPVASLATISKEEETLLPIVFEDAEPATTEKETLLPIVFEDAEPAMTEKISQDVSPRDESNCVEVTPGTNNYAKTLIVFEDGNSIEKENQNSLVSEGGSPPISARLRELSNNLKTLYSSTPLRLKVMPKEINTPSRGQLVCTDIVEPKTPVVQQTLRVGNCDIATFDSPKETFNMQSSGMKHSLVQEYLKFLNSASKEELKRVKGIGEKRATYILELREESPEPFKQLDDLQDIGLSAKQIKGMMKKVAGELFN